MCFKFKLDETLLIKQKEFLCLLMSHKPVGEAILDELALFHIANVEMCLICEKGLTLSDWSKYVIFSYTQNTLVLLRQSAGEQCLCL